MEDKNKLINLGRFIFCGAMVFSSSAFSSENYWPLFTGHHVITSWTCESTFKDSGCRDSAIVSIYERGGRTQLDVLDARGRVIRSNELVEKSDAKNSYAFGGTPEAPTYTVEAKDSGGKTYFYNIFEIKRTGFSQFQESQLGGLKNFVRREFAFQD